MDVPEDLRYSKDHEWIRREDNTVRIGITDYARDALGDVVYVSLPEVGAQLEASAVAGEVESTKAVSEIYNPIAGRVVEINEALNDDTEPINQEPYGSGWLYCLEPDDPEAFEQLLDATGYRALTDD